MRDAMSAKDMAFNVKRLRKEGKTKLGRADAREAWWTSRAWQKRRRRQREGRSEQCIPVASRKDHARRQNSTIYLPAPMMENGAQNAGYAFSGLDLSSM
jgi:hypothetical protein